MRLRLGLFLLLAAPAFARDLTRYILVLNDAPAGRLGNRAALVAAHTPVREALRARGAKVTAESHTLLNAIFVEADGITAGQLEGIPGVSYAARIPAFHMMLDRAVELLNVPAAWSTFGGPTNAGAGIRIAIIDSGIESTHPAFNDPSMQAPASFPACSISKLPLVPLDCTQFTNGKVIVARSYVPYVAAGSGANPALTSRPDDYSPRDRVGHGTAVAMAAAGSRNTGPGATITGVAPKAWLGSYKVFGSPGVNDSTSADAILAALEDAFNDHMDIAVMSLGAVALVGPDDAGAICGNAAGTLCDPFAAAVKNAVNGGMVVVAAAGNEGLSGSTVQPTWGSISTPAHASASLAVGAITNSHTWSSPLTVTGLGTFQALQGAGPAFVAPLPLSDAAQANEPQACSPLPSGSLAGAFALIDRGTCTFAVKVQNAAAAGASGVLFVNAPGDNSVLAPGGLSGSAISAAFVGYADGQSIRMHLKSDPLAKASVSATLQPFEVTTGGQIAGFSSRGPVLATGGIKPDVTAPGTDLYLTGQRYDPNGALYSQQGYVVSQGTSFAAPLVGGIAALVKQAKPFLTAAQIKSAIVNTASADSGDTSVYASGAGRANAANAVSTNLAAVPSSVTFGLLNQTSTLPLTRTIQLTNTGSSTVTLSLAVQPTGVTLDRTSLTLAPGQSSTVALTLSGSLPAPGVYDGFISVQGAATPFRIPWVYLSTDGVPWNIIPLIGDGDDGNVSEASSIGIVLAGVRDRYGIPVSRSSVRFAATTGGGRIRAADVSTDVYGIAGAALTLGPAPGVQTFTATSGNLTTTFNITARNAPAILAGGVVDAAGFTPGGAVAPGSYIAIYGSNLAPASQTAATPALPVSMKNVSVSFDSGTASHPGRLHFVTPAQINVQVPWEFSGSANAQMKVSVESSSSALYTVPLATYAPAAFEYQLNGTSFAAARDENFELIGPSNPARQGRNIQIYCNALGPVTNQPGSGEATPLSPTSATTTLPVVTVGGQPATVLFSGLTPTVVGLYQINLTVPPTGAGTKPVIITIGGVTSKASSLAVQ
ncbi:MAG: peptidase and in, kexin, sedolisin [Bryobacterales bacterium]|nr:peptidase and in, kexin, sedolisin [Bryobacterales bacterium]